MTENWRPVMGFEGVYEVSDLGRARFVPKDRPVKAYMQGNYPAITLHKHGSRRVRALHILILEAFKGPRPLGLVGAHLDGNTNNARLDNLDWVTPLENERHKVEHGTAKRGAKSHFAKFDEEQIAIIRRARQLGLPAKDIAKLLRVYPQTIFDIVREETYPKDDHATPKGGTPMTPPPAAPAIEGEETAPNGLTLAENYALLGKFADANDELLITIAQLRSDLQAARDERDEIRDDTMRVGESFCISMQAVTDKWQAAEANLIALAKMYGEACGELARCHWFLRRCAVSEITDNFEAMVVEGEEMEARAIAAESTASQLSARVRELEEALQGLVESLRPSEHVPFEDPVHGAEIEALGRRIGFGALMSSASAAWEKYLAAKGHSGGEFVSGPCRSVLKADLRRARSALSFSETEKRDV